VSIAAVCVRSSPPKFRPLIVTVVPVECTAFELSKNDTTGASYENLCTRVPTTAETVTALDFLPPGTFMGALHRIAVTEVQELVEHG
jgi:hypothetical protein